MASLPSQEQGCSAAPAAEITTPGSRNGDCTISPASPDDNQCDLVIIHFNDVYEVASRKEEPVGGAARYKTCFLQDVCVCVCVKKHTFKSSPLY